MLKCQLYEFIACLEAAASDMTQDAGVGRKLPYIFIHFHERNARSDEHRRLGQ